MKNIILLSFVITLTLTSCGDSEKSGNEVVGKTMAERVENINTLEKQVFSADKISNPSVAKHLVKAYLDYANAHVHDPATAEYLFKAATISRNLKNYRFAIDIFSKIHDGYEGFDKRVDCANWMAFIYDFDLNDREKAKQHYQFIIDNYKDHAYALDASARLMQLKEGLTDEQLIEQFKKQNSAN